MAKLITDKVEKALRQKFHAMCYRLGIDEPGKRELLASYGCVSTLDLTLNELTDLCKKLETLIDPKKDDYDVWRKRVIASIFAWLKAVGRHDADMRLVKGIACRAAQKDWFNDIPMERLRSLYSAFTNKVKDLNTVDAMTVEEIDYQSFLN